MARPINPAVGDRGHKEPDPVYGARWIELGRGRFALVDSDEFNALAAHRWYFHSGYAARRITVNVNKRALVYMHRLIARCPPGMQVDHINSNTLDNRKGNLRSVTKAQNSWNQSRVRDRGELLGVTYCADKKRRKRWRARIGLDGKEVTLGVYETREEATAAYGAAARLLRGVKAVG